MHRTTCLLSLSLLFMFSCHRTPETFKDAIAAWSFTDTNDLSGANSALTKHGATQWVNLAPNDNPTAGGQVSDQKAVYFDGASWLDAGQGVNDELKIGGKGITLFVRMKPDSIKEYNPLLEKSGTDQHIAYSIGLHKQEEGVFIETILGSDNIGGAILLKYKLPKDESLKWHDILVRFNGKTAELYVDAVLRDNEVIEGEIRDWNNSPVLIGAQHKQPYIPGDSTKNGIESSFKGWIDCVAIWDQCLTDERSASLSGATALKKDGLPEYYHEKYRPAFHFTAKKNWLNDPNGLVYYDGVYHLFFQYMPPHRDGAYKDWGHATSKDLIHWTQNENHITPHKVFGGCWSGSAVVDSNNTSGFQIGKNKPIIAFITNGGNPNAGFGPKCTQCIAYSTDGGNTFTYYDRNPVIENLNDANRDPKVVWDEDSKKWIMSLYIDKDYDYTLFSSSNLRDWKQLSTVTLNHTAECPGFEPFALDGDKNHKKWVFSGANGNYIIGSFDGNKFTPETGTIVGDYGNNFYAPQIWNNAPSGRHIQIAWMPTNRYPEMPFDQQMNFPTELQLRSTHDGIRLCRMPINEIKSLYKAEEKWKRSISGQNDNPLKELTGDLYDLSLEIDLKKATSFQVSIKGATIQYDAVKKILRCGGPAVQSDFPPEKWKNYIRKTTDRFNNMGEARLTPIDNKINLRILVDRTTLEIFGNHGEIVMSSCFMPDETMQYALTSNGEIDINAEIHSLNSAWTSHTAQ